MVILAPPPWPSSLIGLTASLLLIPLTPYKEASLIGRIQQGGIWAVVEPPTPLLITMPSRTRARPSEGV